MVTLNITRWLIGYVRFTVGGANPERFYSLSARSGAYLWDMEAGPHGAACVAARRYRYLRVSARRTGCVLRVRERHGLPFLIRRTAGHPGLWVGAALFALIFFFLSLHVWSIEVTGCSPSSAAQIRSALEPAGLRPGTLKSRVDPGALAQQMMLRFPQIRWMSVNLHGCAADVAVREKTEKPPITENKGVCNIKASAAGQILSMQVYAGTAMVGRGDAVTEGQLLVSAIVEDQTGGSTLLHAAAVITAETDRPQTVRVELRQSRLQPTGKTVVRRNLDLFGAAFPVTFARKPGGNCRVTCEKTDFQLFGTVLPAGIYTERWEEMRAETYTLTRRQALDLAKRQAERQVLSQMKNGGILSVRTDEKWEKDTLEYTARFVCREDIAQESEIFIK